MPQLIFDGNIDNEHSLFNYFKTPTEDNGSSRVPVNNLEPQHQLQFYQDTLKQLTNELLQVEDELSNIRYILAASSDPILITDPDAKIIYVNPAWEKLTGYFIDEVIGNNPKILQSGKTPRVVFKKMWQALSKNLPFSTEEVIDKRKDGTEYQIYSAYFPVTKNGRTLYYVQIQHDITERKKLEDLKGQFLSMAAHELKTPITTLKLLSQAHLAKYKKFGADQISNEELELMNKELNRLVRLIDDVLDDARIENGKLNLKLEVIDLNELTKNVVTKMSQIATNHKIIFSGSPKLPAIADEQRIEQVLINLITNAIRYSKPNSRIEVSLKQVKNQIRIAVKDYGVGISPDKFTSIFERFYQVNNHSNTGFGLGLYISKEIIDAHKGKIWVESEINTGSIFYFSIPLLKA